MCTIHHCEQHAKQDLTTSIKLKWLATYNFEQKGKSEVYFPQKRFVCTYLWFYYQGKV